MAGSQMRRSRDDLLHIERRIQWIENRSQLEQRIRRDGKFYVVAKGDSNSVSLLDTNALQSARQCVTPAIEFIVCQCRLLVTRMDPSDYQRQALSKESDRMYAALSPCCETIDAKCSGTVCSKSGGYREVSALLLIMHLPCIGSCTCEGPRSYAFVNNPLEGELRSAHCEVTQTRRLAIVRENITRQARHSVVVPALRQLPISVCRQNDKGRAPGSRTALLIDHSERS